MEEWRDVPGYEGWYQVSDQGRVRRIRASKGTVAGAVLSPWAARSGHEVVSLSRDGRVRKIELQRLVYQTFCSDIPEGQVIHHINKDRHDNRADNLMAVTRAEHRKIHQKDSARGNHHGQAKMSDGVVFDARVRFALGGVSCSALARQYGVAEMTMFHALRGDTWAHVGGPLNDR